MTVVKMIKLKIKIFKILNSNNIMSIYIKIICTKQKVS